MTSVRRERIAYHIAVRERRRRLKLILQSRPLIDWTEPFVAYAGFIASFAATGAVGFRFAVLRERILPVSTGGADAELHRLANLRAAAVGLCGALVSVGLFLTRAPGLAERQHTTIANVLTSGQSGLQLLILLALAVGLILAMLRFSPGWWLAGLAVVAEALRPAFTGQWNRLANPIHMVAGGMWIGTLFIMVLAGLGSIPRSGLTPEARGLAGARMVNAFSPVALTSAAVLAASGITTAWLHLKYVAALWTTPYGWTLIGKLVVVAGVVGLGAWNWRRQRPMLGAEPATRLLRKSATAELIVAALVLAITSILVSLPSPHLPGH